VPAVAWRDLTSDQVAESSQKIRRARPMQRDRFREEPGVFANAHMSPRSLRRRCKVAPSVKAPLPAAVTQLGLSDPGGSPDPQDCRGDRGSGGGARP